MSGNSHETNGRSSGNLVGSAPARRLTSAAKEKVTLWVNVGIDFGTSSTKVVFTDRQLMPRHVCSFADNPAGYPPVCFPSSVRVADGRVYFGTEAEQRSGGVIYRSFKMCMTCAPTDGRCHSCPNPLGKTRRAGLFALEPGAVETVTAAEVAAWYLGCVVNLAQQRVERQYPGVATRLTYQTAAPLKSCERSVDKRAFEEAIEIGLRIAPGIHQGIGLSELRGLYSDQRTALEDGGLPAESERVTSVIPETHAAVIGFVRSPTSENGLYAIVDVGAGTSDMSFLRLFHDNNVLSYYSSEVTPLGGDAVDREILRRILAGSTPVDADGERELLANIRTAKHCPSGASVGRGLRTDGQTCQEAASTVARSIFGFYEQTWVRAYQKEMVPSSWERFTLYLCGGGSRLEPAFPKVFRQRPKPKSPIVDAVDVRQFEVPDNLECDGADGVEEHGALLLVAYGVAFHRGRLPEWILSGLVKPFKRSPEPVARRSWDDYGKEGQWW